MIVNMDHIAIQVSNLQASIHFYRKFGFEEIERVYFNHRHIAMLDHKEGRTIKIELIQPDQGQPLGRRESYHFAFSTFDLPETIICLKQQGIVSENPNIRTGFNGTRFIFIYGPDQEVIQIVESTANTQFPRFA